ncbi:MAG: ketol-acid reductoisomerase [Candidatus Ranarchaeia archaeon]|jgi:ketol-acid reductoisomerase
MTKVYHDKDVDLEVLKGKTVAILGYGSQGKAQSQNMRDSGLTVIIGAGDQSLFPDWNQAKKDGFEVFSIEEATKKADIVHVCFPDPVQPEVYKRSIHKNLREGQTLSFVHGFNILYGLISPPKFVDVVLFVPNAPGPYVREQYLKGGGAYGCISVDQDYSGKAKEISLALAKAAGSCRIGTIELTFQAETEGDNFEEQVLYGGTIHLMRAIFNTMVENGYPPIFAYSKAIRSLRSIVDVIDEVGIEAYLRRASRTCEFAVRTRGPRVINYEEIQKIFQETEKGIFAKEWLLEYQAGMPTIHRMRRTEAQSRMEIEGKKAREIINKQEKKDEE